MKWLAYGLVGFCSGAFVGWGAYVSFIRTPISGESGVTFWLVIAEIFATFLGAGIGTALAVLFGWSIQSRRR